MLLLKAEEYRFILNVMSRFVARIPIRKEDKAPIELLTL